MIRLKSVNLKRFMGYTDTSFSFENNGKPNPINLFFGPNGTGKTSILQAIQILGAAYRFEGKDTSLLFRKSTFSRNYDLYSNLREHEGLEAKTKPFEIEGIFDTENGDKRVIVTTDRVVLNELPKKNNTLFIDADNSTNLNKFQLLSSGNPYKEMFVDMAKVIYGFNCDLESEIEDMPEKVRKAGEIPTNERLKFYTDFVIEKYDGIKVHFKRMSGGEKKIAKVLESMCTPDEIDSADIIIIDSFEKEIYFKRHGKIIDKLLSYYPSKQFFVATHSETMIKHVQEEYSRNYLYDIEEYKMREMGITERLAT